MLAPKTLALAALLSIPASHAYPQNVFPSCYDTSEFKTESKKDVSEWKWWGSSSDICQAPCELAATETEGESYSWSWSIGGGIDLKDAMSAGLSFGQEITTYKEKGTVRNIQCPESKDEDAECHCGFLYRVQEEEASGTEIVTAHPDGLCGDEEKKPFKVVAPVKNSQGLINVDWIQCNSAQSKNCPDYDKYDPCLDGR